MGCGNSRKGTIYENIKTSSDILGIYKLSIKQINNVMQMIINIIF